MHRRMAKLKLDGDNDDNVDDGDRDMFGPGDDAASVFPQPYHLAEQKFVGLDSTYVLDLARSCDGALVGAALSDSSVHLYGAGDLAARRTLSKAHDGVITGLRFAPRDDPHLLYTCSRDETVKAWDLREDSATKPALTFAQAEPHKPLLSFDVSCDGKFVCAGTEQVVRDSFLLFWDARQPKLLGGYWDSHQDDVTCVRFHPDKPDRVASGGTDGLVNVFDLAQACEDDALEDSLNTESSLQKLTWYGGDRLACVTHTEEVLLWRAARGDAAGEGHAVVSRDDVCSAMRRKVTDLAYVVDCHERRKEEGPGLLVLAGSSSAGRPCLRMLGLKKNRLKPHADLAATAKAALSRPAGLARCSLYDAETESVYTGGENGLICLWKTGGGDVEKQSEIGKEAKKKKKKKATPYDK